MGKLYVVRITQIATANNSMYKEGETIVAYAGKKRSYLFDNVAQPWFILFHGWGKRCHAQRVADEWNSEKIGKRYKMFDTVAVVEQFIGTSLGNN